MIPGIGFPDERLLNSPTDNPSAGKEKTLIFFGGISLITIITLLTVNIVLMYSRQQQPKFSPTNQSVTSTKSTTSSSTNTIVTTTLMQTTVSTALMKTKVTTTLMKTTSKKTLSFVVISIKIN